MKASKKSPLGEDKSGNGGRWMLTYSDMITLLLALFIVLYSMSSINAKKYQQVSESMHSAFNNTKTSAQGGGGTGQGIGNAVITASSASKGKQSVQSLQSDALGEIYSILNAFVTSNHLQDRIELTKAAEYVQVSMKDMVMFQPDTSVMLPESKPIVKEIEQAIAKVYDRVDHITISGHTADVVEDAQHSDQISWKLSTERAVTVLNSMLDYGLHGSKLSIQGYAHYAPVAPNDTESGRAQNRRVEITIYKNPTKDVASKAASTASAASSSPSSNTDTSSASSNSEAPSSALSSAETSSPESAASVPSGSQSSASK